MQRVVSPNGNVTALEFGRDGSLRIFDEGVWCWAGSGRPRPMLPEEDAEVCQETARDLYNPSFSPDGRFLVGDSLQEEEIALEVLDLEESRWVMLTAGPPYEGYGIDGWTWAENGAVLVAIAYAYAQRPTERIGVDATPSREERGDDLARILLRWSVPDWTPLPAWPYPHEPDLLLPFTLAPPWRLGLSDDGSTMAVISLFHSDFPLEVDWSDVLVDHLEAHAIDPDAPGGVLWDRLTEPLRARIAEERMLVWPGDPDRAPWVLPLATPDHGVEPMGPLIAPDGQSLAVTDGRAVQVLSVRPGDRDRPLLWKRTHRRTVNRVAHTRDGMGLLVAEDGGQLHVYDARTGDLRRTIVWAGARTRSQALAVSPDGCRCAVGGYRKGIAIIDLEG